MNKIVILVTEKKSSIEWLFPNIPSTDISPSYDNWPMEDLYTIPRYNQYT